MDHENGKLSLLVEQDLKLATETDPQSFEIEARSSWKDNAVLEIPLRPKKNIYFIPSVNQVFYI